MFSIRSNWTKVHVSAKCQCGIPRHIRNVIRSPVISHFSNCIHFLIAKTTETVWVVVYHRHDSWKDHCSNTSGSRALPSWEILMWNVIVKVLCASVPEFIWSHSCGLQGTYKKGTPFLFFIFTWTLKWKKTNKKTFICHFMSVNACKTFLKFYHSGTPVPFLYIANIWNVSHVIKHLFALWQPQVIRCVSLCLHLCRCK